MWIIYSVIAAVLWGLDYALTGKVLERIRFSTLLSIELFFGFIVMVVAAQFLFCKFFEHQTEGGFWFSMLR